MSLSFLYGNEKSPQLNKALCEYVAHKIFGRENDFGMCGSLGIFRGQKMLGAVVFHNWLPEYGVIELSAAADSPSWLRKRSIREIMSICFDQHKCQQLVARTAADNVRAMRIFRFLHFRQVLLPNMRGSGKHEFLFMLTSDEWKANKLSEVPHGKS